MPYQIPTIEELSAHFRWADVQPLIGLVHTQQERIQALETSLRALGDAHYRTVQEVAALRAVGVAPAPAPVRQESPPAAPPTAPAVPASGVAPVTPTSPAPIAGAGSAPVTPSTTSPNAAPVTPPSAPPVAPQAPAQAASPPPTATRDDMIRAFQQYAGRFSMQQATLLLDQLARVRRLADVPETEIARVHSGVIAAMRVQ